VGGDYLPEGTELIQLTVDPHLAAVTPVGDSLVGDVRIGLEQLVDMIDEPVGRTAPAPLNRDRDVRTSEPSDPLTSDEVYYTLSTVKPDDSAVVMESTSTLAELLQWLVDYAPATAARYSSTEALRGVRVQLEAARPDLHHDLSALRRESIRLALQLAGEDGDLAEPAFEVFFAARQRVDFYADAMPALEFLAARFPLVAVSNGNDFDMHLY
jgi:hypothetical protein